MIKIVEGVVIIQRRKKNLLSGLITGIIFGFLLQKGGVTEYRVLIGQLLLKDFTVIKIIISAIITGMLGLYFFKAKGLVKLHPKTNSLMSVIIGGLLFGIGFGLLGYCPGTLAGAAGQGNLDAILGGITGILLGTMFYAKIYPQVKKQLLDFGKFNKPTFPEILGVAAWKLVIVFSLILLLGLIVIGS